MSTTLTVVDGQIKAIELYIGEYGNGSDGPGLFNDGGVHTLIKDMFWTTLTVADSSVIETKGFRIFARDTATINSGCIVRNNGQDAVLDVGGLGAVFGTLAGGGDGGTGTFNFGSNSGADTNPSYGGSGGAGGGPGGTAGVAHSPSESPGLGECKSLPQLVLGVVVGFLPGREFGIVSSKMSPIAGGGGGGAGLFDGIDNGGGGGGGAGTIMIAARNFIHNGTIQANGGSAAPGQSGNASGGGGGGGGTVLLLRSLRSGTGTIEMNGGIGEIGSGTGLSGEAGLSGTFVELIHG